MFALASGPASGGLRREGRRDDRLRRVAARRRSGPAAEGAVERGNIAKSRVERDRLRRRSAREELHDTLAAALVEQARDRLALLVKTSLKRARRDAERPRELVEARRSGAQAGENRGASAVDEILRLARDELGERGEHALLIWSFERFRPEIRRARGGDRFEGRLGRFAGRRKLVSHGP